MEKVKLEKLISDIPSYAKFQPKLIKRKTLSLTETKALNKVPTTGIDLKNWSNPILYAPEMNSFSDAERRSVYNLIFNDILEIVEDYYQGKLRRILKKTLDI